MEGLSLNTRYEAHMQPAWPWDVLYLIHTNQSEISSGQKETTNLEVPFPSKAREDKMQKMCVAISLIQGSRMFEC